MAANSQIEWTDATWNPIAGCSIVSPGCHNCYAMRTAARLEAMGQAKYSGTTKKTNGKVLWTGKVNLNAEALSIPLQWRKPKRVFVNSMSDLFHDDVPDWFIDRVFGVMAVCPQHTFQVLTKRAERMARYFQGERKYAGEPVDLKFAIAVCAGNMVEDGDIAADAVHTGPWPLPNVWLGVSVEDRKRIDRIDHLRHTLAAVRFLSIEPLLEDLGEIDLTGISWVIVGGESGHGARPMHPDWARSLRDQCEAASVPFFFKQWGEWAPGDQDDSQRRGVSAIHAANQRDRVWFPPLESNDERCPIFRVGKKAAGRLLDGRTWDEFPAIQPEPTP